ncbi:hypothetical protein E4U17_006094 [Claviceps sp. LM77 group G4]|nr:hypothetical protein E4U17_006094 [Claviceps sp. LM77 group G4]KAG6082092.1 hypothetical protein E4U16_006586 [Claviceps sp. LM84 group G4]
MTVFSSSWFRYASSIRQHLILPGLIATIAVGWLTLRSRHGRTGRSQMMSPDTVSSLFPDRPIRPLPKRRLRERLSPEVADSISYPSSAPGTLPLFHYLPYSLKDEKSPFTINVSIPIRASDVEDNEGANALSRNGPPVDNLREEYSKHRSLLMTISRPEALSPLSRSSREPSRQEHARHVGPQATQAQHSANSSVDGYDAFENTNNKKKRKIPSAGDLSVNGSHGLGSEISALALSPGLTTRGSDGHRDTDRAYNGSPGNTSSTGYPGNGQGFSGPGRGRLGRPRNGRSPLRTISDCHNTSWPTRTPKGGATQWQTSAEAGCGIISSAIANAGKLPPQERENVSLLEQHPLYPKNSATSGQFTFTCDSKVPGAVQWPGSFPRPDLLPHTSELATTANTSNNTNTDASNATHAQSRRRARRRLEKDLALAARERKYAAADEFHHNPPKLEDLWICEFCEYERIFGKPPRVLIRDYELKDRRQRQEEAERKRLLEKAKAKSRKSKKSGRGLSRGVSSGQNPDEHVSADLTEDQDTLPLHHGHSQSTQSDEEYNEEPDDHGNYRSPGRRKAPGEESGNVERNRAKT